MNLATYIGVQIKATGTKAVGLSTGTGAVRDPLDEMVSMEWTSGTAANKADQSYHTSGTIPGAASQVFDFASGVTLKDAFGDTLAFQRIKAVLVENTGSAADGAITVGGTNGGVGGVTIPPGGLYLSVAPSAAGWAVADGSTDRITLTNTDPTASATYRMVVIGATA